MLFYSIGSRLLNISQVQPTLENKFRNIIPIKNLQIFFVVRVRDTACYKFVNGNTQFTLFDFKFMSFTIVFFSLMSKCKT